jgi:acetyl-CoA C-acetyltransferase
VRRAAIVAPVRTAVGTFGGALGPLRAEDLAARAMEAIRIHLHPGRGGGI